MAENKNHSGRIIGVVHLKGNIDTLIETIDSEFGVPKSLMLELSPNWREVKDTCIGGDYFQQLAEVYEAKGTKIIVGDKYRYVVEPELSDEFFELERKSDADLNSLTLSEHVRALSGKFTEYVRREWNTLKNLRSPIRDKVRDRGFLEVYNETQPELTIAGLNHTKYLKDNVPQAHYTVFCTNGVIEKLAFWVHYYLVGGSNGDAYMHVSRLTKQGSFKE